MTSCSGLNVSPHNLYDEALLPMWLYLETAPLKVIKVKRNHRGNALIQKDWCPSKKRKRHQECVYTWSKDHVRTQKEDSYLQDKERDNRKKKTCPHLDLELLAYRTARKIFYCWGYLVSTILLWQPSQINILLEYFFSVRICVLLLIKLMRRQTSFDHAMAPTALQMGPTMPWPTAPRTRVQSHWLSLDNCSNFTLT